MDQSKPKRQFQIPESYYKDPNFVEEVKVNFHKIRKKPATSVGKLQELIDAATQTAKRYKKRKDLERKKRKAQLRNDLTPKKEKLRAQKTGIQARKSEENITNEQGGKEWNGASGYKAKEVVERKKGSKWKKEHTVGKIQKKKICLKGQKMGKAKRRFDFLFP